MLYMPATTTATPIVLQEAQQTPLQSSPQYIMLQSAPIVPAVPLLNTTYVYPRYGFVPKPVETSVSKADIEKSQTTQLIEVSPPVQHVVHHHIQSCSTKTCPGYCELCCPWIEHSTHLQQHRCSRRDEFEQNTQPKQETIDEKIERIRRELCYSSCRGHDKSTETINECRSTSPAQIVQHHIHYRPRSTSRPRSSSSTREPWRSSNQNEYPWRDSHLPTYRDATLSRSQTSADDCRTWKEPALETKPEPALETKHETAHERSHRNTRSSARRCNKGFVYRPTSETEARKWYVQATGKDPDREVHQALRGGTTTYKYNNQSTPSYYDKHQSNTYEHTFYSDVKPAAATTTATSKVHTMRKIDSTKYHHLYACNEPCLHIVPKNGATSDPPYMKILNAPVTYLH